MNIFNYKQTRTFFIFILSYFLILFRNNNIGIDGYYFLAQWKYHADLLEPHHLLHHEIYYLLGNLSNLILITDPRNQTHETIDYQGIFQIFNAIFFVLALIELRKIRRLITGKTEYFTFLLAGFSGIGLRYATDVEVYIFPLFLSLAGTYKIFKFFQSQKLKDLFIASFFIHFAILNHQIQFIWWLILSYYVYKKYSKSFQILSIYFSFSLFVPLIYWIAANQKNLGFWEFAFYDYFHGSANLQFTWKNIFLTLINIPRTFLFFNEAFFHFNSNKITIIFTLILALAFWISLILLIKKIQNSIQFNEYQKIIFHLLIAYILFALISHGNYEFMVCIPFFIIILLPDVSQISFQLKFTILASLFLWNLIFLLIPFRFSDFYGKNDLLKIYQENPNFYFLLKESYWFRNFIYYHTGTENPSNILTEYKPEEIKKLLQQNHIILTDYPNPEHYNRRNFLQHTINLEQDFILYKKEPYKTFYGERFLYEIRRKEN